MSQMYNTKTFTDIFTTYAAFKTEYTVTQKFPMVIESDDTTSTSNLQILYYLLYSRFGNSPIANLDENQFKTKLGAIIWQYGPTWEKKLKIQADIRALNNTDILKGSTAIYNHAFNPNTEPSTQTLTELEYINDQNVTKYEKSKMDAFGQLYGLLAQDVTDAFLSKFKPLFQIAVNLKPYLYESEE